MKYLQLASVSTPAAVSTWFQDELVSRGVDAAYTFYVLSLLREPQDPDDEVNNRRPGSAHRYPQAQANEKPELRRLRAKRCAVECLKSAALEEETTFESFDALVEELLARLEPSEGSSELSCLTSDNDNTSTTLHSQTTSTPPATRTTSSRATSQQIERNIIKDPSKNQPKEEGTLAERAKKYFEAFPALQVQESEKKLRSAAPDSLKLRVSDRQLRSVSAKIKYKKLKKREITTKNSSPLSDEAGREFDDHLSTRKHTTDRKIEEDRIQLASLEKLSVTEDPELEPQPPHQSQTAEKRVTTTATTAIPSVTDSPSPSRSTTPSVGTSTAGTPTASTCSTSGNSNASTATTDGNSTVGTLSEGIPLGGTSAAGMMGSIVHEESLVSSLTKKFDSRLAAIWADAAPVVEEQPSVWRIALDLTGSGNRCVADHDEVIFTIPQMSHFSTILDDEDDVHNTSCSSVRRTAFVNDDDDGDGNCIEEHFGGGLNDQISENVGNPPKIHGGHNDLQPSEAVVQNFVLDAAKNEATGLEEAGGLPSSPTLCLKNSTLNYDKEKTAFTEVVPTRKTSCDSESSLPASSEVPSAPVADFANGDQGEDLLYSLRTHFTPIRADVEDMEDAYADGAGNRRPLSSSLEELSSYHLPPEPPKRLVQKTKQPVVQEITAPNPPAKASVTRSDVCVGEKHDDVRSLWKMVDFEVPQSAVDGDVLGVAQYWQGTAINSGVSRELRQEILEEEEELFKDIFEEAMRAASRTSSLTEDANTTSTGYDSYQDTSLEYGAVGGGADGNLIGAEPCNIEYLSHFSSGSQIPSVFDTPEAYDSAIVTSVRSIQDMQRQRKRQQKKPCTFYMEGNCRRTDCKFSHDLSNITCRFWEDNSCFKGSACPFLHGYAAPVEDDVSVTGSQTGSGGSKRETKRSSKFTIDSEQDFPSLCSNSKSSNHLKLSKKLYKKPGALAPKKTATGKRKKKKTSTTDSTKTTSSESTSLASSAAPDAKVSKKDQQSSNAIKK